MKIKNYLKGNLTFIDVTNDAGLTVTLCNLGASIFQVILDGTTLTRNALNISDFKREECYYGKTVGRTANRVKNSEIKIGDNIYHLDSNEGTTTLHGGHNGLSTKKFDYKVDSYSDCVIVTFTYLSPDGESGYPGNAEIIVKYKIFSQNVRFDVEFEAKSDQDTPISLTNHSYFTLGSSLEDLELQINSHKYLEVDAQMIGESIKVITPVFDFNSYKKITENIDDKSINRDRLKGYDHFFYFDNRNINLPNVSLRNQKFVLDIYSDFEGVQVYTSNFKPQFPLFPVCGNVRDAVAVEPSDNHLDLHILKKGEIYRKHIIFDIRRNIMKQENIRLGFENAFEKEPENIFSCGGRFEILGNHTDHNHGLCLAATCNLAITAGVSKVKDNVVTFKSKGYDPDVADLSNLKPVPEENGRSQGLIRGVASYLVSHGYKVGGFNGYSESTIFPGAGVSSSAAFELLIGQIFNELYNEGKISKLELAKAGQYAENVFFGKASGLLDQIGVAFGNIAFIDFEDIKNPKVEEIPFPFDDLHFVIINTGGSHAALSHLYSAIPQDMYNAAKKGGVNFLRETTFNNLKGLSDIEASRARHFYSENERVRKAVEAIKNKDQKTFLRMINESRISSTDDLKNMMVENQYIGSPLEACDLFMQVTEGKGAIKINGGGFAGSVIAVINSDLLPKVLKEMGRKYGKQNVVEVFVREKGPVKE